jgi:hypothetical protein
MPAPEARDVLVIAQQADALLPLAGALLPDAYYYSSISLCVIDAVFSIGVRYESVSATVRRYCEHYGLQLTRSDPRAALPLQPCQESISTLCRHFEDRNSEVMAHDVFGNRQRTSTRGGILKAEAVKRFAEMLRLHGVEYLQDAPGAWDSVALDQAIRTIPGQRSGISLQYFWMLAGSDDLIKPDRMILRFLEAALQRRVAVSEAKELLTATTAALNGKYPDLTPRLLDFKIWEYQRTTNSERA